MHRKNVPSWAPDAVTVWWNTIDFVYFNNRVSVYDKLLTKEAPQRPRARSEYKDILCRYGHFHYKRQTVYHCHRNPYTEGTASLYWCGPQGFVSTLLSSCEMHTCLHVWIMQVARPVAVRRQLIIPTSLRVTYTNNMKIIRAPDKCFVHGPTEHTKNG